MRQTTKIKRLKVLHLILDMGPGGAERVVLNYMVRMDRSKFDPKACILSRLYPSEQREMEEAGINYVHLKKRQGWDIRTLLSLTSLLKRERFDILHLHNFSAILYGTIAGLLSNRPVMFRTEHNIAISGNNPASRIKGKLSRFLRIFHDRIITVSDQVQESHLGHDRIFQNRYITIHNGVEPSLYDTKISVEKYRQEFGFTEDNIVTGKVASMYPQKAHEDFFRAAQIVLNEIPEARFLVIGDGPRRLELEGIVSDMGLKQEIVFTGVRDDVPDLLQLIDIFALSSAWEGFPMTILEAMASGKPVVVTDVGGNREAVVDGQTGLLVQSANPDELAHAMIELGNDPKKRREMGNAGKDRVQEYFTTREMVKKTEELYAQCYMN